MQQLLEYKPFEEYNGSKSTGTPVLLQQMELKHVNGQKIIGNETAHIIQNRVSMVI